MAKLFQNSREGDFFWVWYVLITNLRTNKYIDRDHESKVEVSDDIPIDEEDGVVKLC